MKKNIYDEKVYLKGDREALDTFDRKKEEYSLLYTIEEYKYEDAIKEYNRYLLLVRDFLKKLDLSSSLEYSIAVAYLIHNGYLTYDKKFRNDETKDEVHTRYGMSIIRGYGVCRNFSDINFDLLRLLDFYVKNLYCYQPQFLLPKSSRLKRANHVISLIEYDGNKYGIDLLNGCALYHFKTPLLLEQISMYDNSRIRNKPYYEIITEGKTLDDIMEELKEYRKLVNEGIISPIEYKELRGKTIIYLNAHKKMLDDFHLETEEIKNNIVRKMKI